MRSCEQDNKTSGFRNRKRNFGAEERVSVYQEVCSVELKSNEWSAQSSTETPNKSRAGGQSKRDAVCAARTSAETDSAGTVPRCNRCINMMQRRVQTGTRDAAQGYRPSGTSRINNETRTVPLLSPPYFNAASTFALEPERDITDFLCPLYFGS